MTIEETEELIDELNLVEHEASNVIIYRGCEIPIEEETCFDLTMNNQN
ncbi:MAG: hypothetical protein IBX72_04205 [Nitrospirae bacterium]|nr:hypothetical protein [Nitrospirota bacterium]